MFRKFEIWRHISCLDMCILVLKVAYTNSEYTKVKVLYVDEKGNKYHEASEVVKIQRHDLVKWKRVV